MLSKAINDSFLNTYFNEDENVFVTELYDKWRQKKPKLLKITYSKEDAEKAHAEAVKSIMAKEKKKPGKSSFLS